MAQDGNGTISFEEFANGLLEIRMKQQAYALEQAREKELFVSPCSPCGLCLQPTLHFSTHVVTPSFGCALVDGMDAAK